MHGRVIHSPSLNTHNLTFGPGLGLQEAFKYLTDPRGRLFGLDISEYMQKVARKRLGPELA